MKCTPKQKRAQLKGFVDAMLDRPTDEKAYHADPFHYDKGGAASLAVKNAKANGHVIGPNWADIAEEDNPVWQKIASKMASFAGPKKELAQALLDCTSQEKTVAKPVFKHFDELINAFDVRNQHSDVYKEGVSNKANAVWKEIKQAQDEGRPLPHGVNEHNYYPTKHFLETISDGYPFFDFNPESKSTHLTGILDWLGGNTTRGHLLLNYMTPVYHGLITLPRAFSQYPHSTLKALVAMGQEDRQAFLGKPLQALTDEGVYSKTIQGSMNNWSKYDWAKGLTFIPQCQTTAETLAYYIAKEGGHPLKETLDRVALVPDPLRMPSILVGKQGNMLSYGRYAMLMDSWYLNLVKRAATNLDNPKGWQALGQLGAYSLMKYYAFGAKSAIPGPFHLLLQWKEADKAGVFKDADNAGGGNLLYKSTGIDLGEQTADLNPWWSVGAVYEMLHKNIEGLGKDFSHIVDTSGKVSSGEKATRGLDMALILSQTLTGWVPQEGIKGAHAYAKAIKDAAGDPAYVDLHQLYYYALEQQFGKETADKWREHQKE